MKYKQTILTISVHPVRVNPIFGEGSTHITLNDEGGGVFIEMSQSDDNTENGVIRLDPDEWDEINAAVKTLLNNIPAENVGIVG